MNTIPSSRMVFLLLGSAEEKNDCHYDPFLGEAMPLLHCAQENTGLFLFHFRAWDCFVSMFRFSAERFRAMTILFKI